ncbi:hypothetical protein JTB14_033819 [Gonioctena quinquepunctata]|nr:hypothetical protein JTB14_033819 [Gonioctena quinquepunctata]
MFTRKEHLKRHKLEQHLGMDAVRHECEKCQRRFKRKYHLKRHLLTCALLVNGNTKDKMRAKLLCVFCNILFKEETDLFTHWDTFHPFPKV